MKKISLILSVLLLSSLISGCNKNNVKNIKTESDSSTVMDSGTSENIAVSYLSGKKIQTDNRFTDFKDICEYNQYTYVSAIYDFSETELTQYLYDVDNNLMTELLPTYNSIDSLAVSGNAYYYTLEPESDSYHICKYDMQTKEFLNDISVDSYGKIKVSGENVYCFDREKCNIYDKELNYKNTIVFSDYYDNLCSSYNVIMDSSENLYRIAYDKEKQVYTLISVDAEGEKNYITSDFGDLSASCDGKITGFFIYDNTLCLSTSSYENENTQFVNLIDIHTGKTINRFEIENAQFINKGINGYDLTYKFNDSLYGYRITHESSEIIYSDSDSVRSIESCSDWNCSDDNIMIVFSSFASTSYNGDSQIVLIFDENMNFIDFQQGAQINKPFYVSDQCIYFLQKSLMEDGSEVINITSSTNGLNRMDYASFETDEYVSEFWIYNDIIWVICSDFENSSNILKCYNKNGKCISEQEFPYSLLCHKVIDGKNTAILTDGDKVYLSEIFENDICEQYILERAELSERFFECYGKNQEVFLSYNTSDNYMKEIDIATSEEYNSMNFSDFGINVVTGIIKKPDNNYVVSGIDYEGRSSLWKISEQDKPCKELRISGVNIPDFYMSIIRDYDDLNDEIRIVTNNYNTYSDEVIADLDKELLLGKSPDIIIGDTSLSIYEYAEKYPLYDMSVLLEDGINKSDFLECTFTNYNSKIVQVIPFMDYIDLFIIPKEKNTFEKWNYSDFFNYIKDNKDDIYPYTSDIWTSILLNSFLYNHIDFLNETCDFENQSFYELLEFIKEFSFSENSGDSGWDNTINQPAFDFTDIRQRASDTDNLYLAKGIPDENGGHILFSEAYGIIIPASAQNTDDALNFIKYLLSDEVQTGIEKNDVLPSSRKNLFRTLEETTKAESDNEEYNEIKYSEYKNILNEQMIADISHSKIFGIVSEEIYNYCENGGSAQETAKKIQKKVQIYLSEL